jgi:hypothetical protein
MAGMREVMRRRRQMQLRGNLATQPAKQCGMAVGWQLCRAGGGQGAHVTPCPVNPIVATPWTDTLGLQQTIEFQHEQLALIAEQARLLASADDCNHPTLSYKGSCFPYRDSLGKAAFSEGAVGAAAAGKFKCLVCESRKVVHEVPVKQMRQHLAAHMLKQHVDMTACGFCGRGDCVPQLNNHGTKHEPNWQVPPAACSRYWVKLKYQSAIGDRSKCSNVPMQCRECRLIVWKYAMAAHCREKHAAVASPSEFVISEEEKAKLKLPRQCK